AGRVRRGGRGGARVGVAVGEGVAAHNPPQIAALPERDLDAAGEPEEAAKGREDDILRVDAGGQFARQAAAGKLSEALDIALEQCFCRRGIVLAVAREQFGRGDIAHGKSLRGTRGPESFYTSPSCER